MCMQLAEHCGWGHQSFRILLVFQLYSQLCMRQFGAECCLVPDALPPSHQHLEASCACACSWLSIIDGVISPTGSSQSSTSASSFAAVTVPVVPITPGDIREAFQFTDPVTPDPACPAVLCKMQVGFTLLHKPFDKGAFSLSSCRPARLQSLGWSFPSHPDTGPTFCNAHGVNMKGFWQLGIWRRNCKAACCWWGGVAKESSLLKCHQASMLAYRKDLKDQGPGSADVAKSQMLPICSCCCVTGLLVSWHASCCYADSSPIFCFVCAATPDMPWAANDQHFSSRTLHSTPFELVPRMSRRGSKVGGTARGEQHSLVMKLP